MSYFSATRLSNSLVGESSCHAFHFNPNLVEPRTGHKAVEVASCAARVAQEDMLIGPVGIDRFVAAEQTSNSVAATVGGVAGLLIYANRCRRGTSNHSAEAKVQPLQGRKSWPSRAARMRVANWEKDLSG